MCVAFAFFSASRHLPGLWLIRVGMRARARAVVSHVCCGWIRSEDCLKRSWRAGDVLWGEIGQRVWNPKLHAEVSCSPSPVGAVAPSASELRLCVVFDLRLP